MKLGSSSTELSLQDMLTASELLGGLIENNPRAEGLLKLFTLIKHK